MLIPPSDKLIAAVDSHYQDNYCCTAIVGFTDWGAETAVLEQTQVSGNSPEAYKPGQFYLRELPLILEIIEPYLEEIEMIIVDGYVWLGEETKPGLGAYLYEALESQTPVIGVAKSFFSGSKCVEVLRGKSKRPLFVTSAGISIEMASHYIERMAGKYRIPTLLKRVDQLTKLRD
ncbi:MAG: endonuclease V [Phycisphaeraceae bacterium]